ncbi:MAG: M20/M25/M40 family metallo-hydrolase [Gammaproteobacteria bacterium]
MTGLLWLPAAALASAWQHALEVRIEPEAHRLEVTDTITRPADAPATLTFALHPGLSVEVMDAGARLAEIPSTADGTGLIPRHYRVEPAPGADRVRLRYHGRIHHGLQPQGEEYSRGFRETPGTISGRGVFLAGRSYWYPRPADDTPVTFDLTLHLPPGWSAMSQGTRLQHDATAEGVREAWRCTSPQEEIYLIAGKYTEYRQESDGVTAMVLLREPDAALAQRYLDATARYIRLYSGLIGPYPYAKFALVENFWETGYGMPSFTLLGPKVIRFPFILHSSYPHEILHNWWGNGVYIDYAGGNWAEGLTSYLADHLIKEQAGQGADYRRGVLHKYTDHVRTQQDFPLVEFRGRHSAVTEAVGYGKTLMLFHMLRHQLGDAAFLEGLQALYRQYRFRVAGFGEVEAVFSATSGQPLGPLFEQWTQRSGAPRLRVSGAQARPVGDGFTLTAGIEQIQPGPAYRLQVPIAVHLEGRADAWQRDIVLADKHTTVQLELPARPYRLEVDPEFDVFRRLDRSEIPPAISQALGADAALIVLPSAAPPALRGGYETLAHDWQRGRPGRIEIVRDDEIEKLPADRAVWLFGWENRFRPQLAAALEDYAFADLGGTVTVAGTELQPEMHAVVVLARQAANPEHALGWLAAGEVGALPGLARKLPHYGKYSYLAFTGTEPVNVLKGQWPVVDSPLSVSVVQSDGAPVATGRVRLAPRTPLAAPAAEFFAARMQQDIAVLANDALQGRGIGTPQLERAAVWIAERMQAAGLEPGAGESYLQTWEQEVAGFDTPLRLHNVIGVLPGTDPGLLHTSLVIGAHYDHLGRGESGARGEDRGRVHPGADDNASGVAVLLELARSMAGTPRRRSVVFVAFTGEETGRLGSRHFMEQPGRVAAQQPLAMINLDTVGRLGDRPLIVFGTGSATEWTPILHGAGYVTGVPLTEVADDIGSSDQTSFIAAGVPAVQLFSGVHADYHRPGDTADKIDAAGLVKTARVAREMVDYLAERPEPLTATTGGTAPTAAAAGSERQRRISLGTVPDYAWRGDGVRLEGVRAGTPAAQAGLQAGDIITRLNGRAVTGLQDYSRILRELNPGAEVSIRLRRDGREQQLGARVEAR